MQNHLRANLLLVLLTLVLCSVLYPLLLWVVGQAMPASAGGSFVDGKGNPVTDETQAVGSNLIAQPFTGDEFFQPRPSGVSYNAAATGGTNWGSSNPNLRNRVLGVLGPMLKYKNGQPVGPDIAAWVRETVQMDPAAVSQWLKDDVRLAARWSAADSAVGDFLTQWSKDHADDVASWQRDNADSEPAAADLAGLFLESVAQGQTKTWPETSGKDLQVAFFDLWWRAHPSADVEPVPSDLVMASGSGMDPHITLKGAMYQLNRVAAAWAAKKNRSPAEVRREIESMLAEKAGSPLAGLAGVPLVNVLEINLALRNRYGS